MNGACSRPQLADELSRAKPSLADVTLVAVTSVALRPTADALRASMRQADFGRVLLLSDTDPGLADASAIGWRPIEPLRSRADYSHFMLRDLADHIETSHALCVQWDGFVLDGTAWEPAFLDYDYVGAPWPQFSDGHNVGNGGFSLRSQALIQACRDFQLDADAAEDVLIARVWRPSLEARGFRFAPEAVARRFAYERTCPSGSEFGFHGAFNLVRILPPDRAVELFGSLEPGILTRSEVLELLRWAMLHRRGRLALTMLSRWLRSKW